MNSSGNPFIRVNAHELSANQGLKKQLHDWNGKRIVWQTSLAYRHKQAEHLMYAMFVSGLLLWPALNIEWSLTRWALALHMLVGVTVFPLVAGCFWWFHRRLLSRSSKPFLKMTGRVIELLLVLCSLTGGYLWYVGATGDALSLWIQDIHFYSSCLLAPLVFRHAFRWSVLNVFSK